MLPILALVLGCTPLGPGESVLTVVAPSAPELDDRLVYARALVSGAAPFPTLSAKWTREALVAESGIQARREALREALALVDAAREAYTGLEAQEALDRLAEATPLFVASQSEPGAVSALSQAHLLAGTILVARDQAEAARSRLLRALDLDPELEGLGTARLLGVLASVRAEQSLRTTGSLVVSLVGTATRATVFLDGRRLGRAPNRFDDLPSGRHLIRVSSPGFLSIAGTVRIDPIDAHRLEANLQPDLQLQEITQLGPQLVGGGDVRASQAGLTRRSGASRTLVATLIAAPQRGPDANFELGLRLDLEGAGRRSTRADPEATRAALLDLARCSPTTEPPLLPAPPWAATSARLDARPIAPSPSLWQRPWVWLTAAVLTVTAVGTLAAVQGASAPPDEVQIELVPRP